MAIVLSKAISISVMSKFYYYCPFKNGCFVYNDGYYYGFRPRLPFAVYPLLTYRFLIEQTWTAIPFTMDNLTQGIANTASGKRFS